jgi:hypothetical protein
MFLCFDWRCFSPAAVVSILFRNRIILMKNILLAFAETNQVLMGRKAPPHETFQVLVIFAALCICQSADSQTRSDIQVLQATYGAGDQQIDVTPKVKSLVQSGQTNVRVRTHLFGKDPVFGQTKTLHVLFSSNGVHYDTDIREGGQLSFSSAHQLNVAPQTPAAPISPASTVQEGAPSPLPPPEQHRLAPEGTFYLMERVVVKSDPGVTGFAPGTRVKLIEDRGEKLFVTMTTTSDLKRERQSDERS